MELEMELEKELRDRIKKIEYVISGIEMVTEEGIDIEITKANLITKMKSYEEVLEYMKVLKE